MNANPCRTLAFLALATSCAACAATPANPVARPPLHGDPEPAGNLTAAGSGSSWEIGAAGGISLGDGEPSNDATTYGLFARTRLGDDWAVRLTLEQSTYDFERPAKIIGIMQDPSVEVVDASATATSFQAWIERCYRQDSSPSEFFWGAGLGVATVDVDDATGPVLGGGTFDIETDAGTEFLLSLDAGYRYHLSDHWTLEALTRLNQHFADWELKDRVSGTEGNVDDYLTWTILFGIGFGF